MRTARWTRKQIIKREREFLALIVLETKFFYCFAKRKKKLYGDLFLGTTQNLATNDSPTRTVIASLCRRGSINKTPRFQHLNSALNLDFCFFSTLPSTFSLDSRGPTKSIAIANSLVWSLSRVKISQVNVLFWSSTNSVRCGNKTCIKLLLLILEKFRWILLLSNGLTENDWEKMLLYLR